MDDLGIAERVVIRHVCRCKAATEEPGPDDMVEHVFTVDGEDFPWFITERGPLVARLADDLYTVDIEILALSKQVTDNGYHEVLAIGYQSHGGNSVPYKPVIGGVPFPYTCTGDVMTLRFCHKVFPTLHLKFFARDVDAKGIEIEDQRLDHEGKAVWRAGGDLIREGKVDCYECGEWVDDLFEHAQERHGLSPGEGVTVSRS